MRVFKSGNDKTNVTISIGVASPVIRRDMQLSELITAADECLSMAISRGGNQVIYDDDPVDTRTAVPTVRVTRSETNTHTRAVFAESRPTTTPASKANPFHREDVEVEEIEIFTADYPFAHFGAARHDRVEIKNRSGATPGHVPNTAAATVSGKAVFTSSPAASNAKPGIPSQPHVAAPAELTLTPINPADDAVTGISSPECEGEITAGPASPMTDLMKGSSDTVATPNGSSRVQPVKSRSTIKHARRAHRPGVLKRMLAWFGLARSPR